MIGQQYQTALSIASVQPRMELLLQKKKIRKYLKDECCYCFFFSVLFRSKKVDVHKQNFNTKQRKKRWLLKEDMCSSFMMFYCVFFFKLILNIDIFINMVAGCLSVRYLYLSGKEIIPTKSIKQYFTLCIWKIVLRFFF